MDSVFFFMVFSKAPKAVVFFFLVFWKLHGYGLLLPSRNLKIVLFFFIVFSKAPKAMVFFFLVFPNSMAMVFFFLAKTSKSWSCSSWFFPKFPKPSSSSCPHLQSHCLLLSRFFQSSQSYCLLLHGFLQSSQSCAFRIPVFFPKLHGYGLLLPSWKLEVVVSIFSWFFPKFPKLSSFFWPYP